ncbi:MAG: fibronectin type III domain-containing protein, partial [Verrucomicrobiae bacterium]|nr:fibronectin type III domain-containing protein [Verrucomicrobiae bacterium]
MGQLLNSASLSLKFKYSTNATGSGGEPLFFGVSPNSSFNGDWTGGSSADYIGVELSQRLTGSNESKLVLFNGVDGSRSAEADSAFENLSPGWYEIELNVEQAAGLLDLSVALHKLSTDGSARETTDVVTGAISSLTNADLQNAGGLYIFLGGGDTLNRGIVAMDDLNFFGFGTPGVIVSPSGLAATTVSANQINLSWSDNSDNETQFHVERRLSGGNWSLVTSLGSGVTSYSDTGLNQGTTYFYRVSASNNESTSSPSNEASATTSSTGGGSVAAPTHLSAVSLTSSEIKVAWTDNSDNETAFLVERRLESGSWSQVASVPANSINYLNTGLSADTTFFYRVIATNGSTNSDPSNQASAITSTSGRPSVPGNLVASAVSGTQINLTWTDTSNNETWFRIERRVGSGSWIDLIDLTGNSTSHSDTGLTADTTYTYRIRSGNAAGLSNPGNEASATTTSGISINAPTNLAATAASDRQINLSWTDNSTNETSFRVQRRQGSSSWAEIVSLAPNSTSYSDSGLAQETSYSYRILASNNGAFSSPSNEASATTQGEPAPTPPANLVASARTMSQIDLSWSDTSSNETWFRIQRRVGSGNWADLVDLAANSTNYSDTGLSSNTSYTYRMRAGNATGLSTLSNEASATTPTEPVPNGPTNLQNASPDFSKISLSWTDNANDESGYRIQRKVGSNNFEQIAQLPAGTTSFEDTEITDYQTYVYYVYAYNDIGSSAFSNLLAVDIPFFSPTNLVAVSPASDRVDLSWSDNSKVETSYRIQRRKGTGSWITMVNVGENVASYSDVTVEAETTYTYRVQGIRHSYFSEYTNFVSLTTPAVQPPTAPSGLVIASQGLDHVVLQWSDKSTKETGFIIERTTNGGGWETLIQLGRDVVTYTDGQVSELGNYQYRVVSYNAGGNSSPSNVVSTMIDFDNPTDLTALAISSGQVDLSWTDNSSAEGNYRVERKSAQGAFEVLKLLAANSTNYSDTDVEPLSTYTYMVVAIQGDLSSQPTNEASANTPNIPAPGSAGNLAAVLSSEGIISVTWEDNSITEAGFRLERMVGTGAW